jgi:two-component system, LytTR family, sensor kinase
MHGTRPYSLRWPAILAVWSGVALFDATQTVAVMHSEGMHHAWFRLFLTTVLSWVPWAAATPAALFLGRRYPPLTLRPVRTWAVHIAACVTICFFYAVWNAAFQYWLNPYLEPRIAFTRMLTLKFDNGLLASFILYATIIIIGQVIDSRARLAAQQTETARLNEQLSREQLNALRRQIEPHFLFNSLNGIAGLIRENRNEDAVGMLAALSDFLRHLLQDSSQQVTFAEELEFLHKYLDIEKMRLGDRLRLAVEVAPDVLSARVPSLILQPMVENSIKHGISKRAAGGQIRLSASRNNGTLNVCVYNDGPALQPGWEATSAGIGIANVRSRLEGLYGERFAFNIENQSPEGVQVTLSVPFESK